MKRLGRTFETSLFIPFWLTSELNLFQIIAAAGVFGNNNIYVVSSRGEVIAAVSYTKHAGILITVFSDPRDRA